MERLTTDERIAALSAMHHSMFEMECGKRAADYAGNTELAAFWQRKHDELKSAYDKLVTWPWEPEAKA